MGTQTTEDLLKTPLHGLHVELGAKMVPFAGYDMPVQYKLGVLGEHLHTRNKAGLFDVSHMGPAFLKCTDESLTGDAAHEAVAEALETLIPGDIKGLAPGQMRYTQLLNDNGGIMDDLMVTRSRQPDAQGMLFLVVNAGCKENDFRHIEEKLAGRAKLNRIDQERSLLALQGPEAANVLARFVPEANDLGFMELRRVEIEGERALITRSGYTGEDGYEICVMNGVAEAFARKLLAEQEVEPIGLGARDSLRLEAGLCLYGHDIDETTTPVEAALTWSIGKRRREEGGFPGAQKILGQIADGAPRKRVGIRPEGKGPAREGTEVVDTNGNVIGTVTSGGFGPTANAPVAMGYVTKEFAKKGTPLTLMVRGKPRAAEVVAMPFIEKRYRK
ncbi:glycine cleavage system aminomethyltransferase GcvT [Parvibaculaceae bacterium PLY_AMNH_Bact1]|nr:glycine cleavage system aminomethyltransferase GcvT [Parvibaculaceae bacterium PLY_AMNH_Bact1]